MTVLLELGEVNWKERVELSQDLDDEDGSGTEKILMAIDRLETTKKCKVFGKLCKLKAFGKIDSLGFLRLTKLIQDAYLFDLYLVTHFKKDEKQEIWEGDYFPLLSLGLIFQEPSEQMPIERNFQYEPYDPEFKGGKIALSDLGKLLLENYYYLFPEDAL